MRCLAGFRNWENSPGGLLNQNLPATRCYCTCQLCCCYGVAPSPRPGCFPSFFCFFITIRPWHPGVKPGCWRLPYRRKGGGVPGSSPRGTCIQLPDSQRCTMRQMKHMCS